MRWFVFVVVLALSSCSTERPLEQTLPGAKDRRIQLMRVESEVYGDFFRLRTFHNELMQVRVDEISGPYPAMDTLYHHLFEEANTCVGRRVTFDSTFAAMEAFAKREPRYHKSEEWQLLMTRYYEQEKELVPLQESDRNRYFELRKSYQDTCALYGIQRLGPEVYAQVMNEKLGQWLDSLEECGRMVARAKQDLKARFPDQKGKPFFSAYQPLSLLEADMKGLESILSQLQNAISRFEEGNKQDIFYFGPYLRKRMEVQVTEDFIGQLSLKMKDCRLREGSYYRQYEN